MFKPVSDFNANAASAPQCGEKMILGGVGC